MRGCESQPVGRVSRAHREGAASPSSPARGSGGVLQGLGRKSGATWDLKSHSSNTKCIK